MKIYSLTLILLVLFVSCDWFEPKEEITPEPVFPEGNFSTIDSLVLNKLNEYRLSANLARLVINKKIWVIANKHSISMAKEEKPFNHDGFSERADDVRKVMGLSGIGNVGENLALIPVANTNLIINYWNESPTHKKNVEGDYTYVGISAVKDKTEKYYYITAIFFK